MQQDHIELDVGGGGRPRRLQLLAIAATSPSDVGSLVFDPAELYVIPLHERHPTTARTPQAELLAAITKGGSPLLDPLPWRPFFPGVFMRVPD